jgi:membrane glycosyltransferase
MPAIPWFGLWRGVLMALWPGLGRQPGDTREATPPWLLTAQRRRRTLLATVLSLGVCAALLGPAAGVPPGWPLLLMVLLFAWVGAGLITALMGAWVLWRGDAFALQASDRAPISRDARTAIIMPICNEELATVFGGLRATCESLASTGALNLFDIFILSDTSDPALRAAEIKAWRELRASLGDAAQPPAGRIHYRLRRRRSERKAGNVADFCRRWGSAYRYMVVLDADSVMHGDTLVQLVRLMEQHPRAGILQTLPQPLGRDTVHARAQQFSARISGRLFALGMSFWQMGESHYWGHNAILRMQPFMAHCRMAPLPGRGGLSGHILSHDFVEAALMRRAGYEVWLIPSLGGSWEQTPSNLMDELQRDRRWCQGNLQNARLIAEPGWRPAHRAMLATGAFSYLVAPLWLALLCSGAVVMALAAPSAWHAAAVLWGLTLALLMLPRLIGLATIFILRQQADYGGTGKLLASTAIEAVLSALQAPVRMLAHTVFVVSALTGLRLEWRSPPRNAESVGWTEALHQIGWLTLPALALALWLVPGARHAQWTLLPVLLPLALAVPMVVASGNAMLGGRARSWQLLSVAEERRIPRPLLQARNASVFKAMQPAAASPALAAPNRLTARAAPWRGAWAAAALAAMVFMVLPRPAIGPSAPASTWLSADDAAWQRMLPTTDVAMTGASAQPRRRVVAYRPARFIDDAVRVRARMAVDRALTDQPDTAARI